MAYKFGVYTEITTVVLRTAKTYQLDIDKNSRFFVCVDVRCFWLARLIVGIDIEGCDDPDSVVLEVKQFSKKGKAERLDAIKLNELICNDNYSNVEYHQFYDYEDAIEHLVCGWELKI